MSESETDESTLSDRRDSYRDLWADAVSEVAFPDFAFKDYIKCPNGHFAVIRALAGAYKLPRSSRLHFVNLIADGRAPTLIHIIMLLTRLSDKPKKRIAGRRYKKRPPLSLAEKRTLCQWARTCTYATDHFRRLHRYKPAGWQKRLTKTQDYSEVILKIAIALMMNQEGIDAAERELETRNNADFIILIMHLCGVRVIKKRGAGRESFFDADNADFEMFVRKKLGAQYNQATIGVGKVYGRHTALIRSDYLEERFNTVDQFEPPPPPMSEYRDDDD